MAHRDAPALLDTIPEEGARRLALRWIDAAADAAERLLAGDDPDALHALRVALRKLRTVLRSYERELRGSVRRRRRSKLERWMSETGAGRDAEVQLEWLDRVRGELESGADRGVGWLAERLEERRRSAYAHLREVVVPELRELLRKLRRDLERYELEHVVGEPAATERFGERTAVLLRGLTATLRDELSRVGGPEDEELAHDARKTGKRLRYLLEPLRDESVGAVEAIVRQLKSLQSLLGELNDVAVRAALLRDEIPHAAAARARRLTAEAEGLDTGGESGSGDEDEERGLLALMRITHERRLAIFDALGRDWLARGGALDALVAAVESLAVELAAGGDEPPREIERKYLLSALPPHARDFPWVRIDQGYVPGERLHERLRRTKRDGTVRCHRTVKLGSGISRIEIEEETTPEIFSRMWTLTRGKRVRKRRWKIPAGELTWEVDEFLDRELVLAEIELPSEDAEVEIPEWLAPYLVREVTDDPRYLNLNLAR